MVLLVGHALGTVLKAMVACLAGKWEKGNGTLYNIKAHGNNPGLAVYLQVTGASRLWQRSI